MGEKVKVEGQPTKKTFYHSLESIFITVAIKAQEGHGMTVIDLPEAFLQIVMDEQIIMVLKENWQR